MENVLYEMNLLNASQNILDNSLLVLVLDKEDRSKYALSEFLKSASKCDAVLVFAYEDADDKEIDIIKQVTKNNKVAVIKGFPKSQIDFIAQMREIKPLLETPKIIIDISCILTPFMFLLFKCIYEWNRSAELYAINTIPFDYAFFETPFTSYKSYYGNLRMEEIFGFSSNKGLQEKMNLFIFAGFEGSLALKVVEDTECSQLFFVNALPSYHQKYKDLSIINNYQLLLTKNWKRLNVPATNPFEVYNLLSNSIDSGETVSIAPLSTKPISLGICMFALENQNVRIVYPFSDRYESYRSHSVYKSYIYKIPLE